MVTCYTLYLNAKLHFINSLNTDLTLFTSLQLPENKQEIECIQPKQRLDIGFINLHKVHTALQRMTHVCCPVFKFNSTH